MLKENTLRADEKGLIGPFILLVLFFVLLLGVYFRPDETVKIVQNILSDLKHLMEGLT